MADKLQKIREEVARMHDLLPVMDGDNISVNYADRICTTLEMYIDSLQEESVSEELEEAAKQYEEDAVFYASRNISDFFKAGAKWQKAKDESITEDLGEYINELSKQFPEVSFAKLSRIAVRVSKWQKQKDEKAINENALLYNARLEGIEVGKAEMKHQMMVKAIDVEVKVDAGGYPYIYKTIELYDYDRDIPLAKEGDRYKVILIKED